MDMFWLGCFTVVVIIFMVAIVVGMVLIWKIGERLKDIERANDDFCRTVNELESRMDRRVDETYVDLERKIEGNQGLMASFVDSRIDKLENKLK